MADDDFTDVLGALDGLYDPSKELDLVDPAQAEPGNQAVDENRGLVQPIPPGVKLTSPLSDIAEVRPARLLLWEADDVDSIVEVNYNPTEFEAGTETEWNRFVSPGGSYAHLHFVGTRNFVVEMEVYWVANTIDDAIAADEARKRLLSWCYPGRTDDGWSLGPPRLWARWPGTFEIQCYIVELRFRHLKFALDGRTTRWSATIKLEELSDTFIGSSVVRGRETVRGLEARPVRMDASKVRSRPANLGGNPNQVRKLKRLR